MAARLRHGALKRFARRKDGAAALEFAMVAPWFFLILIALLEISMIGFAQTNLDFAVSETARRIRTGQVQAEGLAGQAVEAEVCANLNRIMAMGCGQLSVDVDSFDSFNAAGNPVPMVNGQLDQSQIGYQQTQAGEVVLVRGYYEWRIITPFFQQILGDLSGGRDRLLVSSVLFRNEPFPP
jgi:Flp pilus assembly protein TadG